MTLRARLKRRLKDLPGSLLHNAIAHPLMVVLPSRPGQVLHDRTFAWWQKRSP